MTGPQSSQTYQVFLIPETILIFFRKLDWDISSINFVLSSLRDAFRRYSDCEPICASNPSVKNLDPMNEFLPKVSNFGNQGKNAIFDEIEKYIHLPQCSSDINPVEW